MPRTNREHLAANYAAHPLYEFGFESRGETQRHRKAGSVLGQKTGAALLVKYRRDAEPALLDQYPLDRIHGTRGLRRRHQCGVTRDMPDSVFEHLSRAILVEPIAAKQLAAPD